MSVMDTLKTKIGIGGARKYESSPVLPPFSGLTLKEKLQVIVLDKRTANRSERIRNNQVWYLCELYYRSYQSVELSSSGNSFEVYEREDFYVENQFRKHVDTVKQILNKSEGDIVVRPASDAPKDIATSRVADPILAMQRDAIGYERVMDQKNLNKCLFGNSFQFTDYITDKKYGSIVTPKFSYQETPDPTFDPNDPMNDPGAQPPTMMSKVVSGYSTRNRGKQVATVCSPLEINCPMDVMPFTQLPYIQWISHQDIELLNYLYPGLNATTGSSSQVSDDLAQQYLQILGRLPGNLLGESAFNRGDSPRQKSELVRSWLQPCTFRGDKELEREFPDGAHVTTIDGKVVDWYNEDLLDRWTHEVLIPVPHSLLGDGLYDAILMQDQINEINSLLIQHMRYTTVGHTYYDSNVLDSKDIVNDPKNGHVPIKLSMDKAVQQAIMYVGPGQLSGDVPAWLGAVKQAMQDMTSYDVNSGKEVGANSPYSQSVFLAEKSASRWDGSKKYNRPEMIRFNSQLLEDARKNWIDMRQQAVVDNTGNWSFQQFSQADLQGDVDILLSDSDVKPKSRAEQIQGLQMLQTLAPMLPGMPPKQKLRIEEMLGLPPDANPTSNQISRAYRMIDRITKGEVVTPLPMLDDAQMQVPVFADFLVSEKGEDLAEKDPKAFADIYTYMTTLTMMMISQMGSPGGAQAAQIVKPQPQGQASKQGSQPAPQGTPGGNPGQQGGGNPNPGGQAQSPAPAPPMPPQPGPGQG